MVKENQKYIPILQSLYKKNNEKINMTSLEIKILNLLI